MGAFGTDQTNLSTNTANDISASWYGNNRVIFSSNRSGNYSIYLMNDDGSNQEEFISILNHDIGQPVSSPAGGHVVFSSATDNEIYLHSLYLDVIHYLTDDGHRKRSPTWDKYGLDLLYYSDTDATDKYDPSQNEIFTMGRSGGNRKQLTHNDRADLYPQLGEQIYVNGIKTDRIYFTSFDKNRTEKPKIYSMDFEGSNVVRLTNLDDSIHEGPYDVGSIDFDPYDGTSFFNTGITYDNLDLYEEAIKAYSQAIIMNPLAPLTYLAYQYRGDAYKAIGNHALAQQDYDKSKELGG